MLRKLIPALLLILILMTSLTGCTDLGRGIIKEFEDNKDGIMSEVNELKDGIADELNDWLESISKYNITKDKNLKGERKLGVDNYVVSYEAEYVPIFIWLMGQAFNCLITYEQLLQTCRLS